MLATAPQIQFGSGHCPEVPHPPFLSQLGGGFFAPLPKHLSWFVSVSACAFLSRGDVIPKCCRQLEWGRPLARGGPRCRTPGTAEVVGTPGGSPGWLRRRPRSPAARIWPPSPGSCSEGAEDRRPASLASWRRPGGLACRKPGCGQERRRAGGLVPFRGGEGAFGGREP